MSVDVSDAVMAPTDPPGKAVAWCGELVASSMPSWADVATLPADEVAALWNELWVSPAEIDAARHAARADRMAFRSGYVPCRPVSGHKRPGALAVSSVPEMSSTAAPPFAAACSSPLPQPASHAPNGLCLVRGFAGGNAAATGAGPAFTAPPASLGGPAPPAAEPPLATMQPPAHPAAGLWLQRAASLGTGSVPSRVAMRPRSASAAYPRHPLGAPGGIDVSQAQKRVAVNRNPHGLSMSQRVAALQIGRPASFAPSTM